LPTFTATRPVGFYRVIVEILSALRRRWLWVSTAMIVAGTAAVLVTLALPRHWRAETLLIMAVPETLTPISTVSEFGQSRLDRGPSFIGLELLRSPAFLAAFVRRHDLAIDLLAGHGWNPSSGELFLDPDIYHPESGGWQPRPGAPAGGPPSDAELAAALQRKLSIVEDEKLYPLLRVRLLAPAPGLAHAWLTELVAEVNETVRREERVAAEKRKRALFDLLDERPAEEVRAQALLYVPALFDVLTRLEAEPQYAFRIIDPPSTPINPHGPRRALVAISIATGTGLALLMVILVVHLARAKN
jgi:uncharacterized protein involved in exopolysaccharide biosynthesis